MTLARLCEHDQYSPHLAWDVPNNPTMKRDCPGGTLLPPDSLVIENSSVIRDRIADVLVRQYHLESGFAEDAQAVLDALAAAQPEES